MEENAPPRGTIWEALWRAHHAAWQRSNLNQREYCAAQGLSLKALGNWRAKFKAEPQPPAHKLPYRRGGASHRLSHTLSHRLSHTLSHMTYPFLEASPDPIVRPARAGHRRPFSEEDRRRIPAEADRPSVSEVARRYGIAHRVLCRWRQETAATPVFVDVEIVEAPSTDRGAAR